MHELNPNEEGEGLKSRNRGSKEQGAGSKELGDGR